MIFKILAMLFRRGSLRPRTLVQEGIRTRRGRVQPQPPLLPTSIEIGSHDGMREVEKDMECPERSTRILSPRTNKHVGEAFWSSKIQFSSETTLPRASAG